MTTIYWHKELNNHNTGQFGGLFAWTTDILWVDWAIKRETLIQNIVTVYLFLTLNN